MRFRFLVLLALLPIIAAADVGIGSSATGVTVDATYKNFRVRSVPGTRNCYSLSSVTGTIGAALAANSSVFAMRVDPGSSKNAWIRRMRITYTTIVVYTTPVTAGRRLALFRGSGAAASGGTALSTAIPGKDSTAANSEVQTSEGGDARISTTGALTVTGITFEAQELATMSLVHVGAAGASFDQEWLWDSGPEHPLVLRAGQLLAIRNPAAMDAAGTWQAAVTVDWCENLATTDGP